MNQATLVNKQISELLLNLIKAFTKNIDKHNEVGQHK